MSLFNYFSICETYCTLSLKRIFALTLTVFYGLPAAELVGKTFRQGMGHIRPYTAAFAAGVMTVRWNASFTHLVQMQNSKS